MNMNGLTDENVFFNPTTGRNYGGTGLSNEQVFYNPAIDNKAVTPKDNFELSKEEELDLGLEQHTYNNLGILFSSEPLKKIHPDYSLKYQYNLIRGQRNPVTTNYRILTRYFEQLEKKMAAAENLDVSG
jgi:hypothetical protein